MSDGAAEANSPSGASKAQRKSKSRKSTLTGVDMPLGDEAGQATVMPAAPGSEGGAGAPQPPPGRSQSSPSLAGGKLSWEGLEALKARAAGAMDRVEYLASSRNLMTDLRASEARELEHAKRHRADARKHMSNGLSKQVGAAALLFEKQRELLAANKTAAKRLNAVNRYVVGREEARAGSVGVEAAKAAMQRTRPDTRPYPTYQELFHFSRHVPGEQRDSPIMAVKCHMRYMPPEDAIRHGMGGTLPSKSRPGALAASRKRMSETA